ncbi:MAG: MarR family transcriptional regulator [Tissierellia bacterium]|nr:MarR family transcriptional regulator [Tissierellia bacterium]
MQNIELKILVGLHRNVNKIDRKTKKLVAKHGLTLSQFMVLEVLYAKGDMTVGEVRDKILSTVGTISLIVNNLVKQGYVERLGDEKDRRVSILHLTPEGREIIGRVFPENQQLIEESMAKLSEDEKKQLLYILKKMGGKLDEENRKDQSKGI